MTHAAFTEWMDKKERDDFDRRLLADDSSTVSRGTRDLMALMGVRQPPNPAEA